MDDAFLSGYQCYHPPGLIETVKLCESPTIRLVTITSILVAGPASCPVLPMLNTNIVSSSWGGLGIRQIYYT